MGTLADKLQAVLNSKNAIKAALTAKGRTPSDVLSTYAGEIEAMAEEQYAAGAASSPKPTGNAVAGEVVAGKTFSNASGTGLTGTMPNRGNWSSAIATSGGLVYIPAGYHTGGGTVVGPTFSTGLKYQQGYVKSNENILVTVDNPYAVVAVQENGYYHSAIWINGKYYMTDEYTSAVDIEVDEDSVWIGNGGSTAVFYSITYGL